VRGRRQLQLHLWQLLLRLLLLRRRRLLLLRRLLHVASGRLGSSAAGSIRSNRGSPWQRSRPPDMAAAASAMLLRCCSKPAERAAAAAAAAQPQHGAELRRAARDRLAAAGPQAPTSVLQQHGAW
jgi:hypothetical protein